MRFLPDETRIYGPQTFSGGVLTDVGFELPDLDYDEYAMEDGEWMIGIGLIGAGIILDDLQESLEDGSCG